LELHQVDKTIKKNDIKITAAINEECYIAAPSLVGVKASISYAGEI